MLAPFTQGKVRAADNVNVGLTFRGGRDVKAAISKRLRVVYLMRQRGVVMD
jgi:hypothetical protein